MTVLLWCMQGLDPSWYGGKVTRHQAEVALREVDKVRRCLSVSHISSSSFWSAHTHTHKHAAEISQGECVCACGFVLICVFRMERLW